MADIDGPEAGETDLSLTLEENAEDSLIHGVEHFLEARQTGHRRHFKNTILHTFHATELFLKAKLGRAHPILIFETPEHGYAVSVQESARRYPAWKEHFISRLGKDEADVVLENTTPTVHRKLVVKS